MTKSATDIHNIRYMLKHKNIDLVIIYREIEESSKRWATCILADEYSAIATLRELNNQTRKAVQLNLEIIELESKLKELLN